MSGPQFHSDEDDYYVDNIEEESLEHDVEKQIDRQIAEYNIKKESDNYQSAVTFKQPDIQSAGAKRNRIVSAKPNMKMKNELPARNIGSANPDAERRKDDKTQKNAFYDRFNGYVKVNHITPEDFWSQTKQRLTADEFKERLEIAGFNFSKEEFEDVVFDITNNKFYVSLETFASKIKAWKGYGADKTLEVLKENSIKIAQESRKKLVSAESSKKSFLVRPQSGNLYPGTSMNTNDFRPFSGISVISAKSKNNNTFGNTTVEQKSVTAENFDNRTFNHNKSAQYIKETKEKQAKQDHVLALTLNKAKNEHEYDCLGKIAEANDLSQIMGEPWSYKAYGGEDGHLKCHIYENNRLIAELTVQEFLREYRMLKMRSNQKQNLKIWEVLAQKKSNGANFYFSSAKAEANNDDPEIGRRNNAKKDRQKELKAVLFETMKISNALKTQLEKLEKTGLANDVQFPK